MRNIKKKLVALGLGLTSMVSAAMSMSASAYEIVYDTWPAYYVPYAGTCYASGSQVKVDGVKWSSAQLKEIQDFAKMGLNQLVPLSLELEFRPYYKGEQALVHGIWGGKSGGLVTNIPDASFEFQIALFENDDVAIVIPDAAQDLVADKSYYAGQTMVQLAGISLDGVSYMFECELGNNFLVDSLPIRCSQRPTLIPFGSTKSIRE